MTAHQRRPGFRLPWSSEEEAAAAADTERAASPAAEEAAAPASDAPTASAEQTPTIDAAAAPPAAAQPEKPAEAPSKDATPPSSPEADTSPDFMRDLVVAMRAVADEARQSGVTDARTAADEQVKRLEADAERRREELRSRADADIAGIGEWAAAEAERIKAEAEQRIVARRSQLDQQLSSEASRVEAESKSLRDRVSEYERELDAYHAQLAEISDPAAFAAAAKRMPRPPALEARVGAAAAAPATTTPAASTPPAAAPAERPATESTTAVGTAAPERSVETNGVTPPTGEVHPAEEQVLASRLAELDATLPDESAGPAAPAGEPTTTEIVVSGLGSFGAITGFRQALAGVDGIDGVALSLGQTGEFIFRATHATGFDVAAAIASLEGDGAKMESRPDGGLHVTLDRPR